MVEELVTDLDLEVVGEEFEEPSESFESSDGEPPGFGEVGENRTKTLLEDLLRELLLMSENASESIVGDDHDLGSGRVDVLEVDRDDSGRKRREEKVSEKVRRRKSRCDLSSRKDRIDSPRSDWTLLDEEVGASHSRCQQLQAGDPEILQADLQSMLSSAADESLVLRVGESDGLVKKTNEFLSNLGKGRVEV